MDKIEELEHKKKQLEARLQAMRARTNAKKRALETRRRIVAGGALFAACGHDWRAVLYELERSGGLREADKKIFRD